jgi:hypothetical protein
MPELYSAVKNAANDGETIVLAPGTYTLFDNGPETRGRIELRKNMSLIGMKGDRSAVKIDTSSLPSGSFNFVTNPGRTGAIRMGLGSNSISWLTILGNRASASGIETDLPGTEPTKVTVAHVLSEGSSRGLDVRNVGAFVGNVGATNAGRRIDAVIIDNDFSSGSDSVVPREAIRLVNFVGADDGLIHAVLRRNRFHNSFIGLFAGNNRTRGRVDVRSNGDYYEHNAVGCVIVGANVSSGTTDKSFTSFFAARSKFIHNTEPPGLTPGTTDIGGIVAVGADVSGLGVATGNRVRVRLSACTLSDNHQNKDFEAVGLRLAPGTGTGSQNNRATIELKGDDLGDDPFRVKGTFD